MDFKHGPVYYLRSVEPFDSHIMCKMYRPFMKDCPIKHTLIRTLMISDIRLQRPIALYWHRKDTVLLGCGLGWGWPLIGMPRHHILML